MSSDKPRRDIPLPEDLQGKDLWTMYEFFASQSDEARADTIDTFCAAKIFVEDETLPEETRLEYIKEHGRNSRAKMKSAGGAGTDGDGEGPFPRGDE